MKNISILVLAVILLLVGCRKDEFANNTITTTTTLPVELVQTSVLGRVINEAGAAVEGAKVSIKNVLKPNQVLGEVITDENGAFIFREKTVNANGTYISVAAPNYFHGSRTLYPGKNSINQVVIQLLSNEATRTIANSSVGGVADYGDYSVALPANGVMTANGGAYTGAVKVAAKWLNPASADFGNRVPGDFRGVRTDESLSYMISMGMLAVELTDASGNLLQVKTGAEAEIKMRVATNMSLPANINASLPLWYFDESAGIWVEEGVATLENGYYVGKVKHFSFWNYDYPFPAIKLTVNVQDESGNPVESATVALSLNNGGIGQGLTDNTGQVSGMVPINETFTANVYLYGQNCNSAVLTQTIGGFSADATITLTIPAIVSYSYTLTGTLINCDGAAVTNGYVKIASMPNLLYVDATGYFEETIVTCQPVNSYSLIGYDFDALKSSALLVVNIASGTNNLGTISVCENIPSYLTYTFGGLNFEYIDHNISSSQDSVATNPPGLYITRYANIQPELNIGLGVENVTGVGTYTAKNFWVEGQSGVAGNGVYHFCQQCGNVTVTITEYNGINGFVAGTFTGTVINGSSSQIPQQTVQMSGTFRGILNE